MTDCKFVVKTDRVTQLNNALASTVDGALDEVNASFNGMACGVQRTGLCQPYFCMTPSDRKFVVNIKDICNAESKTWNKLAEWVALTYIPEQLNSLSIFTGSDSTIVKCSNLPGYEKALGADKAYTIINTHAPSDKKTFGTDKLKILIQNILNSKDLMFTMDSMAVCQVLPSKTVTVRELQMFWNTFNDAPEFGPLKKDKVDDDGDVTM